MHIICVVILRHCAWFLFLSLLSKLSFYSFDPSIISLIFTLTTLIRRQLHLPLWSQFNWLLSLIHFRIDLMVKILYLLDENCFFDTSYSSKMTIVGNVKFIHFLFYFVIYVSTNMPSLFLLWVSYHFQLISWSYWCNLGIKFMRNTYKLIK